jgi:hypothetical protein
MIEMEKLPALFLGRLDSVSYFSGNALNRHAYIIVHRFGHYRDGACKLERIF